MSKRISFIAPVDYMSGNLSGRQELEYATKDNAAYEAPDGKQYARNYKPRFVGQHRAEDGRTFFSVRTKHATTLNVQSRLAMAALGAAASLSEIIMGENSEWLIRETIASSFAIGRQRGSITGYKNAKNWLTSYLREMYALKLADVQIPIYHEDGTQSMSAPINNQFIVAQWSEQDPSLPNDVLVKFWPVLSNGGITFVILGAGRGVAMAGETWSTLTATGHNILKIATDEVQIEGVMTRVPFIGNLYILDGGRLVDADYPIEAKTYNTTSTIPN